MAYNQQAAEMDAALCVWEYVLDRLLDADRYWSDQQEQIGRAELRFTVAQISPYVEAAWQSVKDKYDDPFDWEFVPALMEEIVEQQADHITGEADYLAAAQRVLHKYELALSLEPSISAE